MGQSRPMPRLWQNVAMALVGEASAILAAPKVQPASIVRDMRYQGDSGPSHAIAKGWSGSLAPLFLSLSNNFLCFA